MPPFGHQDAWLERTHDRSSGSGSPGKPPSRIFRVSRRDLYVSATNLKLAGVCFAAGAIAPLLPSRHHHHGHYEEVTRSFGDYVFEALVVGAIFYLLLFWALRFGRLRIAGGAVGLGQRTRWGRMRWDTFGADEAVRFEVRRWIWLRRRPWNVLEPPGGRFVLSLLLTDGTWVQLLPFSRGPGLGGRRRHLHEVRGRWRPSKPLRDAVGAAVVWTAQNDLEIEDLFNALLDEPGGATRGARTGTRIDDARYGLAYDVHRRRRPAASLAQRDWLSEALHGRVDPPIVTPPAPPRPVRPEKPARPVAASLWDDPAASAQGETPSGLELPARYWTLASQRAGSVMGGPASMLINASGIRFARRLRRDLIVPLGEIDRFDIEFDAIPMRDPWDDDEKAIHGNWRLLLFRTDGTTVPLSGLDHGYFKQNQLYWSRKTGGRKLPAPEGSIPWPNDQPLEVAARLNAHLEVARRAAGAATTSGGGPAR